MLIVYTKVNGGVDIVTGVPKHLIELDVGPMTDAEYRAHVWEKSVPHDAIGPREIDMVDIPENRDFRDAWCDVSEQTYIDIDSEKARAVQLGKLRLERDAKLLETDILMTRALETAEPHAIDALKTIRQSLRDATAPLKSLVATSQLNDFIFLENLKVLGTLEELA